METQMGLECLTKKQLAVLKFIRDKIQNRGYGPTVREIGEHFQIRSPNGVMCHLRALERKGILTREPNMSRAIVLSEDAGGAVDGLPMAGRVAAGVMHEAVEQTERVSFNAMFDREDQFVLEVRGDSMIDAHIEDGDFVVIRKQNRARPGQMVVARTDDGEATLKYWHPEKNQIRLQPANKRMKPIYVKRAQVVGVVVGVVRKLTD